MSVRPGFDLQCHSLCSDGALTPAGVVARAADAGVTLLALTDHDTIDGVDEAVDAGARHGLVVVPAVELSAVHDAREDLHILGYLLDHRDQRLARRLSEFRADREARIGAMADALEELGFQVDRRSLAELGERLPVGRPHLAAAAFEHPANRARLREEGLDHAGALLAAYLIAGRPAYRPRTLPSVVDAIAVIRDAGGVAVWAHPFWDVEDTDEVIELMERFRVCGLDGVEAFYPTHTAEQTRAVATRCRELGLLSTGSSDFHGPEHRLFSGFRRFELHGCEPDLGPIG